APIRSAPDRPARCRQRSPFLRAAAASGAAPLKATARPFPRARARAEDCPDAQARAGDGQTGRDRSFFASHDDMRKNWSARWRIWAPIAASAGVEEDIRAAPPSPCGAETGDTP